MALINLQTDLKSLRYGKDTQGGGDSGQPYIKKTIPRSFVGANEDFLLRGGINAVTDSLTDVARLAKMFTDTKSPNGLLFIAKQQLLSRTAVRTQTSGVLNEGVYNPLSTLAQAGVVAFGGHLNKQGINPFAETGAYANNNALYNTRVKNYNQEWLNSPDGSLKNRLFALYESKIQNNEIGGFAKTNNISNSPTEILLYTGGPGSILGIGNTSIRFADQRTGNNNILAKTPAFQSYFFGRNKAKILSGRTEDKILISDLFALGASLKYVTQTDLNTNNNPVTKPGGFKLFNYNGSTYNIFFNTSVYNKNNEGNVNILESNPFKYGKYANNTFTYTQKNIIDNENNIGKLNGSPTTQDFRAILRRNLGEGSISEKQATNSGATTNSLSYNIADNKTIEGRVNLGNPGARADKSYASYENGVIEINTNKSPYPNFSIPEIGTTDASAGLDRITSIPIYRSTEVTTNSTVNDLVKFRIAIIDNNSPNFKTFIHFRAFIDSMSDSYNATWNGFNYLGRSEQFYNYGGFTRTVSLSWTVSAQSKQELIPMYKKLNYLASSLTGDYSDDGYMRGNLVQLTIGGYLYEQPGIITSLTYDVPTESPWEIGIGTGFNASGNTIQGDSSVKELPHIIRVTGFNFIPIQNFVPQKQKLTFSDNNTIGSTDSPTGFVNKNGPERYIALSNGQNNNYDN
jgi:hypothetical protein